MKRNKYHRTTNEGEEWKRKITDLGCILCIRLFGEPSPGIVHHPKDPETGRPSQDTGAICLCPAHHDSNGENGVAFHATGRKTWEGLYGTEQFLYEETKRLIEEGRCRT